MQHRRFRVGFAPSMVAGLRTQWDNMQPYLRERSDVRAYVVEVDKYRQGGLIETLPVVPPVVKGNVRSLVDASRLFRLPQLDALWMHETRPVLPFSLTKGLLQRTIFVSSPDSTSTLQAGFGDLYAKAPSATLRGRVRDAVDTFCLERLTMLCPWSEWAARSLRDDHGFPPHRIQVIPPGIDLDRWPMHIRRRSQDDVARLLFVGGDFVRKGGDLLLDVFRRGMEGMEGRCELHLVTRDDVPEQPGVYVYRNFGPNDAGLRNLYARCDIFVLPTRADCFSLASLEAMAAGLPVITSAIGGIPEIIAEGRSGFLIAPGDSAALAQRLAVLVNAPELRMTMGAEGRRIVETRFDAARNTAHLLDLILDLCGRREAARVGT